MKKTEKKIVRFIVILFGVIMSLFIILNSINLETETYDEYYSSNYALGWTDFDVKGIVKSKHISDAHNNPTVVIEDVYGKSFNFYFQTNDTDFYNYVHIGDSVMSSRRSCKAKVWNEFSSREFDFINE